MASGSVLFVSSLLLILAVPFHNAYARHQIINEEEQKHQMAFDKFIRNHQRQFTNHSEKAHRFMVFKENMRQIDELNKRHNSTTLFGITKFADWTKDEFKKLLLDPKFFEPAPNMTTYEPPVGAAVGAAAQKIDYRRYLTPIRDQGQCGACWSFATIANLEYLYKKSTGKDHDFSEQALLDCDTQSLGCAGGYPHTAFNLMIQKGVPAENEYKAYSGVKGQCGYTHGRATISSAVNIPAGFQAAQNFLARNGPFVGTVMITHALQYFKGGQIYRPSAAECAANLGGHAWLVAGIDYEGNQPYYIIKNSWGVSWGEQGYIRFGAGQNACDSEIRSYAATQ